MPLSRAFLYISVKVPAPIGRDALFPEPPPFVCLSKSTVKMSPPAGSHWAPYGESCPFPELSLAYPSGSTVKEPPFRFPSQSSRRFSRSISRALPICLSRVLSKWAPLLVPKWGPYRERERFQFPGPSCTPWLEKNLPFSQSPCYRSPSPYSPNRAPIERAALSPEPTVYSFVCNSQSPQLMSSPMKWGGKHKLTVHDTPWGWKAFIQWGAAWFPKGIVFDTAVTTPVPRSLQRDTFHFGSGRPEPC